MGKGSIAGVHRLRATKRRGTHNLCRRSAQDDDFVVSWSFKKNSVFSDFDVFQIS